ncbi:phage tail protein [Vibrio furnissii]|uniref:phage tail protein n=1 Tax=Vibrio furnissii TaxID=29494 RepID=UPI001559F675|nr:phage tail protein [Vibrio furnissii]
MSQLGLWINGRQVVFYQASLNYSVDQLAHTFSCQIPPMTIHEPLPVVFRLDDKLILSGQIDRVESSTDASAHAITISGRSKSANMIDSRITMDALYDQPIERLLAWVAKPFGLSVNVLADTSSAEVVPEFQITAESPVDNLAQLVREQGFMLIERNGVLTLENTAHASIAGIGLEVGNNIENLEIVRSFDKQFYRTEVQGAWDDSSAEVITQGISPQRSIVIICDQLQSTEACQSRAEYERDLAIAESLQASASIAGLFPELTIDGLNRVIRVIDHHQGVSESLVIRAIGLSVSESAATTRVELIRPFRKQSNA